MHNKPYYLKAFQDQLFSTTNIITVTQHQTTTMINSIAPPESPHVRTKRLLSAGEIPLVPPSLISKTCDTSSVSSTESSSSCGSNFPDASGMVVSPTPHCDDNGGDTTIQPRHSCRGVFRKKRVQFSELASVHIIENACEDWSMEEHDAVWYSKRSLQKLRWTAHQLADSLSFYSDDELMDRFGLVSKRRQLDRVKEIENIADCVLDLYCDYGITCWDNDVPVVVGVAGNWETETQKQIRLLQRYHLVTKLSARLALRRASLIADQIHNDR
jgi:hypothetical protein